MSEPKYALGPSYDDKFAGMSDKECEVCGTYDHTGTWHGICFECVGKMKQELAELREAVVAAMKSHEVDGYVNWGRVAALLKQGGE